MTFWAVVGILCVAAGIALIYSVLVKKFPQLKLIDLSTLTKERQAEVKTRIMRDRFDRSVGSFQAKTAGAAKKAVSKVRDLYDSAHASLKKLEGNLDDRRRARTPEEISARIAAALARAEANADAERYDVAEREYIEVLKYDRRNPEAYRGLADVYVAQRAYDQAAETLEFLLRLNEADERVLSRLGDVEARRGNFRAAEARYLKSIDVSPSAAAHRAELGKLYLSSDQHRKAFEQFRIALQAEPYHPKYLDYFLEASILIGDPETAEEAYRGLESVNPENAKLREFRERIDAMSRPS